MHCRHGIPVGPVGRPLLLREDHGESVVVGAEVAQRARELDDALRAMLVVESESESMPVELHGLGGTPSGVPLSLIHI